MHRRKKSNPGSREHKDASLENTPIAWNSPVYRRSSYVSPNVKRNQIANIFIGGVDTKGSATTVDAAALAAFSESPPKSTSAPRSANTVGGHDKDAVELMPLWSGDIDGGYSSDDLDKFVLGAGSESDSTSDSTTDNNMSRTFGGEHDDVSDISGNSESDDGELGDSAPDNESDDSVSDNGELDNGESGDSVSDGEADDSESDAEPVGGALIGDEDDTTVRGGFPCGSNDVFVMEDIMQMAFHGAAQPTDEPDAQSDDPFTSEGYLPVRMAGSMTGSNAPRGYRTMTLADEYKNAALTAQM